MIQTLLIFNPSRQSFPMAPDTNSNAAPRVMVRDIHAGSKVREWTGTFRPEPVNLDVLGEGFQDFESGQQHAIRVLPTYQTDLGRAPHIDAGSNKFVKIQPPSDKDPIDHGLAVEGLCIACEDLELKSLLTFVPGRKHHLGWFKDVVKCRHCNLCQLLTEAFRNQNDPSVIEKAAEGKYHFIFVTTIPSARPLARRRQDRPYQLQAWLMSVGGLCISEVDVRLASRCATRLGVSARFHGRYVDQAAADLDLARSWIEECATSHNCGKEHEVEIRDIAEKLVLIDVEKACLADMTWDEEYVALSYVWPRFKTTQLVKGNYDELHQPGSIDSSKIPLARVITDAIAAVRAIGKRYIWIDALCITQDDPVTKDRLIRAMDQVYGRSIFTLIVASECDPSKDYGIPGINGLSRTGKQFSTKADELDLVAALPNYEQALQRSVWSTRGWTFQEGILSLRCLVFTDHQMYFRCARDSRCEDVQAEGIERLDQHAARPIVRQGQLDFLANEEFLERVSANRSFPEYALLVSGYTSRNFTFETDILNGFYGVMQRLAPHFGAGGFFLTLPTDNFDSALLWYPASNLRRRTVDQDGQQLALLPTWSWAAWVGKVDYEMAMMNNYDADSVLPIVQWWRLHQETKDTLVAVRKYASRLAPETAFSDGMLQARRHDIGTTHLIFWGTLVRFTISPAERRLFEWVVDYEQAIPCFTILDREGDACGMLPSADRTWAEAFKSQGKPRVCQFLILSYASQNKSDAIIDRAQFFHEKYDIKGTKFRCFYNVMLVAVDETGHSERIGIGRIHKDAVDKELEDNWERRIMILS
ncbi:HET-domain-containing [Fusarium albosuccineum]|uniref:HET-domain-containing n=1 Tax=Fusarium albosuccineum TaxID=1237068 RepID=A0A8H4L9H5_9HYPO|nr:HET-domain-containing [Fusarium albosuccineum]